MKVKTNLKSGSALENASGAASRAASSTANFLTKANAQAGNLTRGTISTTSSLYNCLSRSFGGV